MENVYSVTEVNEGINKLFSSRPGLSNISIEGEVSNCTYNSSGHIYFTLKDSKSQISAVMFKGKRITGLKFALKDGMKVIVSGSIEVYVQGGKYQLYASRIEEAGLGILYEKYLKLKAILEEKGLFDEKNKKTIPRFASKVGIVTSPTGAAIQDIINVSKRRNPYVELILYPALVQGENAYKSIIKGIKALDKTDVDVIIVGRGGGSIEDLWSFNEEELAIAIYEAKTPIISAVGHETDFTIADFVADIRAATPSQAAEIANFEYSKFVSDLDNINIRMKNSLRTKLALLNNILQTYKLKLASFSPTRRINGYRTYLVEIDNRLNKKINTKLNDAKSKLAVYATKIEALSPLKRIANGYAYVADDLGNRISKVKDIKKDSIINLSFIDGKVSAKVLDMEYKQ
jgi:exodeoxyribonuclease VII, large subunit